MGCCFSEPVDFDGEVTLYHFDLHRAVGKGAFGKVTRYLVFSSLHKFYTLLRCGSSSISALKSCMLSSTLTRLDVYAKRPLQTSFKNVGC